MAIKLAAAAAVAVAGGVLYQKLCAARKRIEELEEEVREKIRFSELPAIDDVDGEDYELQGSLKGLLRKVNHYSIVVRDLAQTEWFYCKLLGFEKLNRPDLPREGLWLWLGNIQLHIILGPHAEVEKRTDGLVCHMSFEAHSMEKVQKELTVLMAKDPSTCYKTIAPVMNKRAITQYFLTDPDGYHIEVKMGPALSLSRSGMKLRSPSPPPFSARHEICDCHRLSALVFPQDFLKREPGHDVPEYGTNVNYVSTDHAVQENLPDTFDLVRVLAHQVIKARRNVAAAAAQGKCERAALEEALEEKRLPPEQAAVARVDPEKLENMLRRLHQPRDVLHYHGVTPEDVKEALKMYGNDVPQAILYLTVQKKPDIIQSLGGATGVRAASKRSTRSFDSPASP